MHKIHCEWGNWGLRVRDKFLHRSLLYIYMAYSPTLPFDMSHTRKPHPPQTMGGVKSVAVLVRVVLSEDWPVRSGIPQRRSGLGVGQDVPA